MNSTDDGQICLGPIDLSDRLLWPDGEITIDPKHAAEFIARLGGDASKVKISHLTDEIKAYNQLVEQPLRVKDSIDDTRFPPDWVLPDRYKYLDLNGYLIGLSDKIEKDALYTERMERLAQEIVEFKRHKLDDVLRCLIYIVETLESKNVVWGVGRGSSCSSYLLFLIGLHSVDPVKYGIDLSDFIR